MTRAIGSHEPRSETPTAITALRAETATVLAELDAAVDAVIAASPVDALDGRSSPVGAVPAPTSRSSTEPSIR